MGNGVTDEEIDGNALVPFVHGMGLISDDLYEVGGATDEAFSFWNIQITSWTPLYMNLNIESQRLKYCLIPKFNQKH